MFVFTHNTQTIFIVREFFVHTTRCYYRKLLFHWQLHPTVHHPQRSIHNRWAIWPDGDDCRRESPMCRPASPSLDEPNWRGISCSDYWLGMQSSRFDSQTHKKWMTTKLILGLVFSYYTQIAQLINHSSQLSANLHSSIFLPKAS